MLKKEDLEKLEKLKSERNSLLERVNKLKNIPQKILIDGVRGSSKSFPYTQHTMKIEGFDNSVTYRKRKNTIKKIEKMLEQKQHKIDKELLRIEYELNYVEEADIREIIRYKYFDNCSWIQIMYKMNYNSESTARMKVEKFFKNKN